ncbi:Transposase IS200 like protein [Rubripirellula amarantea]|uniref:Transposase IS200 like protein n=1 Tax=Rubripirellula amarantea TaxID=2527999 RepID=A0A5C5WW39_9BACT|nr:transposase [Rubripirellula amarantea]TWT54790.1 Transposase IS200 like protein [Rubripirellula amarantea]
MPRQKRVDEAGGIYHALNRGNARQTIFHKDDDYEAFLRTLSEGLDKYPVELFSFCLMPNHWHLVLRPTEDGMMGRFMRWVTATHTLRHHAHYHKGGQGHLYQSRFKSFPIQDDAHFLVVCHYVECNALRANLVKKAENWIYGSLWRWLQKPEPKPQLLTPWPLRRSGDWVSRVNKALTSKELDGVRQSVHRDRPYGDEDWTEQIADRLGLWSTIRPRGRPRKPPSN